jgi:type I restriction enzyme, R subunit
MSTPGKSWNEARLSEHPAVQLLEALGYTYVAPEVLEAERASLKEPLLSGRVVAALQKHNPWLRVDNARKIAADLASIQATSLLETNEKTTTLLAYGGSIEQDGPGGKRGRSFRFFDFEHPENNQFVVTRQLRVKGAKKEIRPDIVVFVNGIPLGVIECKSPTLGEGWKQEALEQFSRYQELSDAYRELGAPRLFETAQVLVATCGQAAVYGTVTTPHRHFAEWKTHWPFSRSRLEALAGKPPEPQDVTLAGLLSPGNLLDLLRSFVVFEIDAASGRKVKKLARYQQFNAVNKAVRRAREAAAGGRSAPRGGVVWHTQGSGKSLTMLWLALKLRRDPLHENPTLVLVTDRKDLDEQITRTFHACGFPNPEQATSVRGLRTLLSGPTGKTVLTTVQKFQDLTEAAGAGKRRRVASGGEVLSEAANLFVLTDEAHRTQYGGLAANMRRALPNAAFFGFTGTPIDKEDRSTLHTFGPYIDTYTIEQAVADGATVPIFYEGRMPELRILGSSLDALFDRVFSDRTREEREAIKKKYGTEQAIATAPRRVEAIALDLLTHYTTAIAPGGFKAQVVACSREAAVLYKEALDRLNGPASAVVISSSNKDEKHLERHHTTEDERKDLIQRFLKRDDPLKILVVCDMLLTGFDAPVEQVMYLDSPLREHTLLQAIARVNRPAEKKTFGLVVDYWGVSEALTEALAIFAPSDVKGAMTPKSDELPRLAARHAEVMRTFIRVADRNDLSACVAAIEAEDVRAELNAAFRRFSQSLDMLLPDPRALTYKDDARWLGKIRAAASARYRDSKLDISDCGAKVKKLIEDAVSAEGIQILVKQVSLFSPDFDERVKAWKSEEARASEMEHALKDEIHVKLEEDPAFYSSLRERLEQIIQDRKAKRIDAARQLAMFDEMRKEMRGRGEAARALGLSSTGLALYGLLAGTAAPGGPVDEAKRELASLLEEQLEPHVTMVDWTTKDEILKEMRRLVKRQLRVAGHPEEKAISLAEAVVDLLKHRRGK